MAVVWNSGQYIRTGGIAGGGGGSNAQTLINTSDISALQSALASVNSDNATQTELNAATAAQAVLDTAQDGNISANASDIIALQAGISAINADNLTQTESDALVAAQAAIDAAQDALISANAAVMAGASAVAPGGAGRVPAPAAGDQDAVLHGDATWRAITPDALADYKGRAVTFGTLPAAVNANDYAILDEDDGANLAGVYIWDGSAYQFGFPLASKVGTYTHTFAVGDWGAASGGLHTIVVAQGTHGVVSPVIAISSELDGSDYQQTVSLASSKILANGDVELQVTESPDNRFGGRVVIT